MSQSRYTIEEHDEGYTKHEGEYSLRYEVWDNQDDAPVAAFLRRDQAEYILAELNKLDRIMKIMYRNKK